MSRLLAGIVLLSLAVAPAPAASQYIDFDGTGAPCVFANTGPLTDFYQALGVTFGGNGAILHECGNFGVDALSGNSFWAFNSDIPEIPWLGNHAVINFLNPVQNFSIFASGGDMVAGFKVGVWDMDGNWLGSTGGEAGIGEWVELSYAGANIGKVEIGSNDDHFVFDNLNANAVPEPSTLILLGTGLVGVAFMARRRKEDS